MSPLQHAEDILTSRSLDEKQIDRIDRIKASAAVLLTEIFDLPLGLDAKEVVDYKKRALQSVEASVMWANKAVSRYRKA